jgi:hypothetical protein
MRINGIGDATELDVAQAVNDMKQANNNAVIDNAQTGMQQTVIQTLSTKTKAAQDTSNKMAQLATGVQL